MTRQIDTNLAELLTNLKLTDKGEIVMLDFEKTSAIHSSQSGLVMDAGWNVVNLAKAMSETGEIADKFISNVESKIIYDILINPMFYTEWNQAKRLQKAANQEVYGFLKLLKAQNWFSDKLPAVQLSYEFANFVYAEEKQELELLGEKLEAMIKRNRYWENFNPRTAGGYRRKNQYLPESYESLAGGQNAYAHQKRYMGTLDEFERKMHSGNFQDSPKWGHIQELYVQYVYTVEKREIREQTTAGQATVSNTEASWAEDKRRFQEMGVTNEIEPWEMVMDELVGLLKARSDAGELLAISAFGLYTSEFPDMERTSSFLGTDNYADKVREFSQICASNMAIILDKADGQRKIDFIGNTSPEIMREGFRQLISGESLSTKDSTLEMRYQNLIDADYVQSHTGIKDAYDQSKLLVEIAREELPRILTEGKW